MKTSDRESWNSLSDLVNSFFDYYFFWNNSIMCKFLIRIQMLLTNSLLQGQRGREKIVFSESIPIFQKVKSTAIYRSWPLILNVCACLFTKRSNPTWLEYFANFLRIQAPQNTWVQWGLLLSDKLTLSIPIKGSDCGHPIYRLFPTWFEKGPPGLRKARKCQSYLLSKGSPIYQSIICKKEALLVCTWLVPSAQSGGHSGDSKVCSHSIYIRTVSS